MVSMTASIVSVIFSPEEIAASSSPLLSVPAGWIAVRVSETALDVSTAWFRAVPIVLCEIPPDDSSPVGISPGIPVEISFEVKDSVSDSSKAAASILFPSMAPLSTRDSMAVSTASVTLSPDERALSSTVSGSSAPAPASILAWVFMTVAAVSTACPTASSIIPPLSTTLLKTS